MKKILTIFSTLTIFFSCQEVVVLDLPTTDPRLVIDASIQREFIQNEETGVIESSEDKVMIILSLTSDFYVNTIPFVNDATVSLTNLSSNTTYNLENNFNRGEYIFNGNDNFVIENDTEYLLTVNYNNEVYESIEVLNISTPIEDLQQVKNENEDTFTGLRIDVSFTDLPEDDNFYNFSFEDQVYLTIEDEFIDNSAPFTFEYYYDEELDETNRKLIFISLWGSDTEFNDYLNAVDELVNGGQNGPFSTVPFEIRGNIVNSTNSENYPYGYFRIHETYKRDINLISNDLAPEEAE